MPQDPPTISLRTASLLDSALLLRWRNDPETRANSWNSEPVSQAEHAAWLAKVLADPGRRLMIAESEGFPIGTARTDRHPGGHELSWTVAPDFRGKGYGKALVKAVVLSLAGTVTAKIKSSNESSQRIAAYAGLRLVSEADGVQLWST